MSQVSKRYKKFYGDIVRGGGHKALKQLLPFELQKVSEQYNTHTKNLPHDTLGLKNTSLLINSY